MLQPHEQSPQVALYPRAVRVNGVMSLLWAPSGELVTISLPTEDYKKEEAVLGIHPNLTVLHEKLYSTVSGKVENKRCFAKEEMGREFEEELGFSPDEKRLIAVALFAEINVLQQRPSGLYLLRMIPFIYTLTPQELGQIRQRAITESREVRIAPTNVFLEEKNTLRPALIGLLQYLVQEKPHETRYLH